jgi:tetratricopeptide (TPR) repeat protein
MKIKQLLNEAWDKRRSKNYDEALGLVKKAEDLSKEDDYNSLGRIFHIYMQLEYDQGNFSTALKFCQKSLEYYRKTDDHSKIVHSLRHIADLQREMGHDADSENNYREVIDIYRTNSKLHVGNLANALRGFGLVLEKRDKINEAISVWEETKELYQKSGIQAGVDEANDKVESLRHKS